ncbi:unnamed protein product [Mucor hiemalis]
MAATPASTYVRQLITPTNNNVLNSPISPDGDENESTHGENNVDCDANGDNDTIHYRTAIYYTRIFQGSKQVSKQRYTKMESVLRMTFIPEFYNMYRTPVMKR